MNKIKYISLFSFLFIISLKSTFAEGVEIFGETYDSETTTSLSLSGKNLRDEDLQEDKFFEKLSSFCVLRSIDLSSNKLKKLPSFAFRGLPLLESIDLSKNRITTLEMQVFYELPSLKSINLSFNQIKTLINPAFYKLPSLKSIDLSNSQIITLGEHVFYELPSLKLIDLSNNQIITLFDVETLKETLLLLELIDLSNNPIARFNAGQFMDDYPASPIKWCDLSENQIRIIRERTFYNPGPFDVNRVSDSMIINAEALEKYFPAFKSIKYSRRVKIIEADDSTPWFIKYETTMGEVPVVIAIIKFSDCNCSRIREAFKPSVW